MDPLKDGLQASGSPADEDVNGKSSNSTDGDEDSSTSTEPETMLDAVSSSLEVSKKDNEEGSTPNAESKDNAEGDDNDNDNDNDGEGEGESADQSASKSNDETGDDARQSEGDDKDELYEAPEGLREKSRERFEKLVTSDKEKSATIETLNQRVDGFYQVLEHAGASPEEFKDLIEFSHNVKIGNHEHALKFIDTMRTEIARKAGVEVPGVDLLEGYDDLKADVESMNLSIKRANEIAKSRRDQSRREQENDAVEANQNQAQATQNAIAQGADNVRNLVAGWKQNDIDFDAKYDLVMEKAKSLGSIPPEQWDTSLQLFYDGLSNVQTITKKPNRQRPLINNGGGGGNREPSSVADAVDLALKKAAGKQ